MATQTPKYSMHSKWRNHEFAIGAVLVLPMIIQIIKAGGKGLQPIRCNHCMTFNNGRCTYYS